MKKVLSLLVLLVLVFQTGCYFNEEVESNQIAVKLYKNQIESIADKPGGVYSAVTCFYCDIRAVDIDTQTFSVEDPSVLTSDNQEVSVKITIQARRKSDNASIKNLLTNWSLLANNDQFRSTISATALQGMKNGVRDFTLQGLLDDRTGLSNKVKEHLQANADKYSAEIVAVTIENIGPSEEYMKILSDTANLKAQTDQAKRKQDLINQNAANSILEQQQRVNVANEQVKAEQAETNVQVEIAKRQGEVIAAQNSVYSLNPQAFELKRLELLKDVLNNKTIMFIPEGTDLNTFINGLTGNVVPVGP